MNSVRSDGGHACQRCWREQNGTRIASVFGQTGMSIDIARMHAPRLGRYPKAHVKRKTGVFTFRICVPDYQITRLRSDADVARGNTEPKNVNNAWKLNDVSEEIPSKNPLTEVGTTRTRRARVRGRRRSGKCEKI